MLPKISPYLKSKSKNDRQNQHPPIDDAVNGFCYRKQLRHFLFSVVILLTLLGMCYCFFSTLGAITVFYGLLAKTGYYLITQSLHSVLLKGGCSSPLAFGLLFAVKVLLLDYDEPLKMMAPTGSDSGASTSFPKPE